MELILALASAGGGLVLAISLIVRNLYYVCKPSEVLIFAGGRRRASDGRVVGYRLVKGGSSLRVPLLEHAYNMDLSNTIVDLRVVNAYSKGGIPLTVEGVANIKVAGEEPAIHNAIERLLSKSNKQIEQLAKETLEGNLRGVLASLTPEQVNEDKLAFARSLLEEAEEDLEKLGLVLDTLQIQNIADDVGYLDSIGRKQQAELLRDARISEAQTRAESAVRSAENERDTSLRRLESDLAVATAEAERRVQDALTQRPAAIAEAEAEIAARVARREAEVAVQQERIKQVEQQLQADTIAPAEARCKQAIARAKGSASRIIEDGKAQAEGAKSLARSWQDAGASAREIFLFQRLEPLLKTIASTIPEVKVDNFTAIDGNSGSQAVQFTGFAEQLRQASGIDLIAIAERWGSGGNGGNGRSLPPETDAGLNLMLEEASGKAPDSTLPAQSPTKTPNPEKIGASIRQDVKQFLDLIASKNPTQTQANQQVQRALDRYPRLKRQLQEVLRVGGGMALQEVFEHPVVKIPTAMLETWLATE